MKDSDLQIERCFTPLEGTSESGEIKLWVKKYPKSEVGSWLHSKNAGDEIEIRGPEQTWAWRDGEWDEVIMVCYGFHFVWSIFIIDEHFRLLVEQA